MDHEQLVREMPQVEKLSTQERLKLAHHRRVMQLRKYNQSENRGSRGKGAARRQHRKHRRVVKFEDNVMLLEAAARNDIDEVRRILKSSVDPDSTNEDGLTALHQCCIDDSEEMMKLLIEYGANVNAEDSEKWTPLHAAATCGHLHLVRYLISTGANLLAVNADGNMPYDICEDDATLDYIESEMAKRGITQELIDTTRASTEMQMLIELKDIAARGGDLEYHGTQGATPLHIAAANGYLRVVEFLLEQDVCVDVRDVDEWQPIHAAACWGHSEVVDALVTNGADLEAKTKNNESPYDICEDPEIRDRIEQLKAEQHERKSEQRRPRRGPPNRRTQSIRRTSVREKKETTRKEARQEAQIRLSMPNESLTVVEDVPDGDSDERSPFGNLVSIGSSHSEREENSLATTQEPKKPDVDGDVQCEEQVDLPNGKPGDNGNINIHVTVTVNSDTIINYSPHPGTLAELKKHRASARSSPLGTELKPPQVMSLMATTEPSPQHRFVSEQVIGGQDKNGCCAIM